MMNDATKALVILLGQNRSTKSWIYLTQGEHLAESSQDSRTTDQPEAAVPPWPLYWTKMQ